MGEEIVNFRGGIAQEDNFAAKTTKIAQHALSRLEKEDLPIFPDRFESVFEELIADESGEFKSLFDQKTDLNLEYRDRLLGFESNIKDGIKNIKDILEVAKQIYQNALSAHHGMSKKCQEIEKIENAIVFKSAMQLYFQDFEHFTHVLGEQILEMRQALEKIAINIENVNKNSIYDTQYYVYNKRYFLSHSQKEKHLLDQMKCPYAFVALSLSKACVEGLKDKELIKSSLKVMAKVLSQSIGHDETICYYGGGKFIVLYKYVVLDKVLERVKKVFALAKETRLIFDQKQSLLSLCAGVKMGDAQEEINVEIEGALRACDQAFGGMMDIKVLPEELGS